MRPLIHIGMPKTATTHLQNNIFTDESIFYPIGRYGPGGDRHRSDVVRDLLWHGLFLDEYSWRKKRDLYRKEIQKHTEVANHRGLTPVLSHEGITLPGYFGSTLDVVTGRLAFLFDHPQVALTIRNQKTFLRSFYSTLVVDIGASISFQDFMFINTTLPNHRLNIARDLHYDFIIEVCQKHFQTINVTTFEEYTENPEKSLERLLGVRGINSSTDKVNTSRDEQHIRWARAINEFSRRGVSASIEDAQLDQNSDVFRKIKQKINDKSPIDKKMAKLYNQVIASTRQQMLTMHKKETLIELCAMLRIDPKPVDNYDFDEAWVEAYFGPGNLKISHELDIDLGSMGYPISAKK